MKWFSTSWITLHGWLPYMHPRRINKNISLRYYVSSPSPVASRALFGEQLWGVQHVTLLLLHRCQSEECCTGAAPGVPRFPWAHKAFCRLAKLRVDLNLPQTAEHSALCSTSGSPCSSSRAWIWHTCASPSPAGSGSGTPAMVAFGSCSPRWPWPGVTDRGQSCSEPAEWAMGSHPSHSSGVSAAVSGLALPPWLGITRGTLCLATQTGASGATDTGMLEKLHKIKQSTTILSSVVVAIIGKI